jgi:hypothetical protein
MAIYLPPGYDGSKNGNTSERYPVIYFFPDVFNDYRYAFDKAGCAGAL